MSIFICNDGRQVNLVWEDSDEMFAWTIDNPPKEIGSIAFSHIEGPSDDGSMDYYLVTNMHLDGPDGSCAFLNQGIGRQIIKQVKEIYPIAFDRDDGDTRPDGSHLTGMGPSFANKMIDEELASWNN